MTPCRERRAEDDASAVMSINLFIHERFEAGGIEFAYPTQTLFLVQEKGKDVLRALNAGE